MQKKIEFIPAAPEPLSSNSFVEQVQDLFKSMATQRSGTAAPQDAQEGELWWKLDYPSAGKKTLMVRSGAQDTPFLEFATPEEAQNGADVNKIMTPIRVKEAVVKFTPPAPTLPTVATWRKVDVQQTHEYEQCYNCGGNGWYCDNELNPHVACGVCGETGRILLRTNTTCTLPAGGTWAYVYGALVGVGDGGAQISTTPNSTPNFCWKIS